MPDGKDPWSSNEWLDKSRKKLERSIAANNSGLSVVLNGMYSSCYSIPALIINLNSKKKLNILDIGGGTGDFFYLIKNSFIQPENVYWHVIDNPKLIAR